MPSDLTMCWYTPTAEPVYRFAGARMALLIMRRGAFPA